MRLSRSVLGVVSAAVCPLFLLPVHGAAQDSPSVSCVSVQFLSPLEDLHRCAEDGYAEAQSGLGLRYYAGGAAPQDYAEAVRWFRLAAEHGYAEAQVMLGVMNANGLGVPNDDAKALKWYLIATEQGDEAAQRRRDWIQARMTPEQVAQAQRQSREWIETHPQGGGN